MSRVIFMSFAFIYAVVLARPASAESLTWDATEKTYRAKPGETKAEVSFIARNSSPIPVVVTGVRTSCGCTVAQFPNIPWTIPPGGRADLRATVDFTGKWGRLEKTVYVTSSAGKSVLTIEVDATNIASPKLDVRPMLARTQNMEAAQADRQAIFRNDCAKCHAEPTIGKVGAPLFQTACGICHESPDRATMVPDLHAFGRTADRAAWRKWITQGKPGTLMPSFARSNGGPLDEPQIDSLVDYLANTMHP